MADKKISYRVYAYSGYANVAKIDRYVKEHYDIDEARRYADEHAVKLRRPYHTNVRQLVIIEHGPKSDHIKEVLSYEKHGLKIGV